MGLTMRSPDPRSPKPLAFSVVRAIIAYARQGFRRRVSVRCSPGQQPVEWWPLTPQDNSPLAAALMAAGCYSDRFGYWWKWFPERVRIGAPEWILDGDMVITGAPSWFKVWCEGNDYIRVTQDDAWDINGLYGEYLELVDQDKQIGRA